MISQYNVLENNTRNSKWTPTAADCYKNGCNCSKCNLYKIYFSKSKIKCKMKATVIELVKQYGIPDFKIGDC